MWAAEKGANVCVRLFIDAGADKEATDNVCYTGCILFVCFYLDVCLGLQLLNVLAVLFLL